MSAPLDGDMDEVFLMAVAKEKERDRRENTLLRTFRESRAELKKVVWPSREEAGRLTVLVIVVASVIGTILFMSDSIFLALYTFLVQAIQSL
jgi:preprotein translocase subunit SecE